MKRWTFGRKIGTGFAALVLAALVLALVAIGALRAVSRSEDALIAHARDLHDADVVQSRFDRKAAFFRGYLLTRETTYLDEAHAARTELTDALRRLEEQNTDPERARRLDELERLEREHHDAWERLVTASPEVGSAAGRSFDVTVRPHYDAAHDALGALTAASERALEAERRAIDERSTAAMTLVGVIAAVTLVGSIFLALILTRTLTEQIGAAAQHLQSSSAELEASSKQQATTSKQQATTTNEVTSTVRELLATSRQIAESAQRVVRIAEQTLGAAQGGDGTVQRAQEAIAGIRRQVDAIVRHMLDLGRKSQEVGTILEIINELSDRTNILAINATIEAAGAGDSGKRFAVVADEIRKLADRVGGATKDIRRLVEEIRAASNTTVLATEQGSKAVDAGARQFGEVTASFHQIGSLVGNTTEAAREIELSTRQQATAVEQVNVAILDLTHSAAELEASSRQTVQIAGELASLSQDLARIVQPPSQAT